jgi:two-component system chemotaxis sensor kinase CheA
LDIAKYRNLFLEEATEHLAEMSRSLLALEKEPELRESIEAVFRAAHSIKSMAASLSYLAHRLEDRMEGVRSAGRLGDPEDLALLFRGLQALEQMVAVVRETGEAPGATTSFSPPSRGRLQRAGNQKKKFAIRLL